MEASRSEIKTITPRLLTSSTIRFNGAARSVALPRRFLQRQHQVPQMTGAMPGRKVLANLLIEGQHSDRVALDIEK
jgi:hypothetical protein